MKKEIGVLRVIGLNEKDLLYILYFEIICLMTLSIVLNLIVAYSFNFIATSFSYAIIFDNIWKLITTILILIVMAIFIAQRWNKLMFKMTAREVLRAGE